MRWITGITLNNYRAFGKPESIDIPNGHHLLVYGENGSGKSSIYSGFKDFFASSFPGSLVSFKLNEFEKANKNENGKILITITRTDESGTTTETGYTFNEPLDGSNHRQPEIQLANKVKGFLDYKRMLQVHALDVHPNMQPNVFSLVVKELLGEHRVADPKGGTTSVEFLEEYNRLAQILCNTRSNTTKYMAAESELNKLNTELFKLLGQVFKEATSYLERYFKNKLRLDIRYNNLKVYKSDASGKRQMSEELYLRVSYAGREIEHYHVFLNEARLSALAVCLYLASVRINPLPKEVIRVLYLDDVFIGLDTSNRIPLLEILRDEFIKRGFQIFISTYDRQWFELARQWFDNYGCKFKSLELYIEDDGNPTTPEYPVVLPSEGNIGKAEAHFKAKDYPATGNYLRKECEAIIKNLLPDTYRIDQHSEPITNLEGLMQQIYQLYEDSNIPQPQALLDAIKIYRKALLNPSSHDDLKSPIYRREIKDVFSIIQKLRALQKLDRRKILDAGQKLSVNFPDDDYTMQLELGDNVFVTEYNGSRVLSAYKCFIMKWTYKGVDYGKNNSGNIVPIDQTKIEQVPKHKRSLIEIFRGINISTGIAVPAELNSAVTIGSSGTLRDLLY